MNGFTTIVGGEGRDALEGSDEAGHIDKLYGGKDDDRFTWSKGFNILHGGQPDLAYEKDGVDLVSYAGAGTVRIDVNPDAVPHYRPDFIVTTAAGLDHLYSIEQIAWDPSTDHIVLGKGVGLVERPVTSELRSESDHGDQISVGTLDARDLDPSGQALEAALAPPTAEEMIDPGASAFETYAALLADTFPTESEVNYALDEAAGLAAGDVSTGNAGADDAHGPVF